MNIYKLLAILNTIGLLGVLFINYLANALPINGLTTGELSDSYPNVFVPAGITFSIWGIIYGFLIAFIVYQFVKQDFKTIKKQHFLSRISLLFFFNCLANVSWILFWHYEMILFSLLTMLVILGSLILIYLRLDIGKRKVPNQKKWLVHIPFSIYLGWITVATIANVTAVLVDFNWNGFGITERIWAVIMIFIATFIGFNIHTARKDNAFLLVLIWAFIGIVIKRSGISGYTDTVALSAAFGALMLLLTIGIGFFQKKRLEF